MLKKRERKGQSWANLSINDDTIIDHLEELAEKFGVEICYEAIKQEDDLPYVAGGICLLRGEYVLIINSKASLKERISTLAMALKHFDLSQIYVRPVLRELLDRIPEQSFISNNHPHTSNLG